ncbi:MAG: hypothetical protein EAZ57_07660 [Cytophagales bacterium]|nr:MAG: hypothetical protein EAZ67_08745 [Cytophagales bacterium]TAF60414.1 MAG: hypothetical protein EAZ57_07660 [Cytophagales bacterium]
MRSAAHIFCTWLLYTSVIYSLFLSEAQAESPDSLLRILSETKNPQEKAKLENRLSFIYIQANNDKGLKHALNALELAQNHHLDDAKADALDNIGFYYAQKGYLEKAYEHYLQAKNININLARERPLMSQFYALADIHYKKNQYNPALQLGLEALKRAEKYKDEGYVGAVSNLLGLVYADLSQYPQAIKYLKKAIEIETKYGRHVNVAFLMSNIAGIHLDLDQVDSAISLYKKAIQLVYADDVSSQEARFLHEGMAETYLKRNLPERALEQINISIRQNAEVQDQEGLARNKAMAARIYLALGQNPKALSEATQAEAIAEKVGLKHVLCDTYVVLAEVYQEQNNLQKVIEYQKYIMEIRESIYKETNAKGLAEANAIYQLDKKEKELRVMSQEADLLAQKAENESLWKRSFIAISLLVLIIAVVIWTRYNDKQKSNRLLESKNAEINQKNTDLEAKNTHILQQSEEIKSQRDNINQQNQQLETAFAKLSQANELLKKNHHQITASINYARRIQEAMLPDIADIKEAIPDLFVLHRARDIVSGDFYWFTQKSVQLYLNEPKGQGINLRDEDGKPLEKVIQLPHSLESVNQTDTFSVLVVADCTGHGVPGAFMSMAGEAFLNQIVNVQGVISPAQILTLLHQNIFKALRQNESENKDGMDITIVLIDSRSRILKFAGAKNSLFYVSAQQPEGVHIKGDKQSVGGKSTALDANFTEHAIQIQEPTMFYMFTDGFQDQFGGGEPPRKFLGKNMRALMSKNAFESVQTQQLALEKALDDWQTDSQSHIKQSQLDDILIVGFRLS